MQSPVIVAFLRWSLLRAALARGWWLVTAVYLVSVARLSPSQLLLIGVFQGIITMTAEIPAGVLADAVSRRLALVFGHAVMGTGMALTGLVTSFPVLVVSNCMWGLGWALSSGADTAWVTDELNQPDLIDRVLTAQAQRGLLGAAAGIIAFGLLGSATSLGAAMVTAGAAMVFLGASVGRWPETGFNAVDAGRRWHEFASIIRRGLRLAVRDRIISRTLIATVLINGGAEGYGRLFERRVLALGLPGHQRPIVWFTAIALIAAGFGALALRIVEHRINGDGVAAHLYAAGCAVGFCAVLVFAYAPSASFAIAGSMLVSGIVFPVTRLASTVLVNRRTTNDVRATTHSLLSQAESFGEVAFGLVLASIVVSGDTRLVLTVSAALIACAGTVLGAPSRGSPSTPLENDA